MTPTTPAALAALAAGMLLAGGAAAADANGNFAIRGAGQQTCGALMRAWDEGNADIALYAGWIDGYLTGLNQHAEGVYDAAPWQTASTLLALVRRACDAAGPEAGVMRVTVDLLRDFAPQRLPRQSALLGVAVGGARTVIYAETLERMRTRLAAEGFEAGPAGDPFTGRDAEALRAFQTARGLASTGLPDQRTLFALFVSAERLPDSEAP